MVKTVNNFLDASTSPLFLLKIRSSLLSKFNLSFSMNYFKASKRTFQGRTEIVYDIFLFSINQHFSQIAIFLRNFLDE